MENLDRNYTYQVPEDGYYAVVGAYDPSQLPAENAIPFTGNLVFNGCSAGQVVIDEEPVGCKLLVNTETGAGYASLFITSDLFSGGYDSHFNVDGNFGYGALIGNPIVDGKPLHDRPLRSEKMLTNELDYYFCDNNGTAPYKDNFTMYRWGDKSNGNYADLATFEVPAYHGGTLNVVQLADNATTIDSIYEYPRWSMITAPVCANYASDDYQEGYAEDCYFGEKGTATILRMNGFNLYKAPVSNSTCTGVVFNDPYGDQRPVEIKGGLDVVVENSTLTSYTLFKKEVKDGNVSYTTIEGAKEDSYLYKGLATETTYALVPKDGRAVKFSECDNIVRVGNKESCEVEIYRDKNFRQVVIN